MAQARGVEKSKGVDAGGINTLGMAPNGDSYKDLRDSIYPHSDGRFNVGNAGNEAAAAGPPKSQKQEDHCYTKEIPHSGQTARDAASGAAGPSKIRVFWEVLKARRWFHREEKKVDKKV